MSSLEEELEALSGIYGEDFMILPPGKDNLSCFRVSPLSDAHPHGIRVKVPKGYPDQVATVEILIKEASQALPAPFRTAFMHGVSKSAEELGFSGREHLFDIVVAANEWLSENNVNSFVDVGASGKEELVISAEKTSGSKGEADGGSCSEDENDDDDEDNSDDDLDDDIEKEIIANGVPLDRNAARHQNKRELHWYEVASSDSESALIQWATNEAAKYWSDKESGVNAESGNAEDDVLEQRTNFLKRHRKGSSQSNTAEWLFTIGLVGKPSSGKSTFFNAAHGLLHGLPNNPAACPPIEAESEAVLNGLLAPVTQKKMAKMNARPFTTLDPNFAHGYGAVECPCGGDPRCCAPYGHAVLQEGSKTRVLRLVHVLLKDVAGLVPGAYCGRGKGNRFLNDLTDADVLIHVVDASGETDDQGRPTGAESGDAGTPASSPDREVGWIREELHRWIYDNVKARWRAVLRRPEKLASMFSGYRADRTLISRALHSAGVDIPSYELSRAPHLPPGIRLPLAEWGAKELHLVVAHFLRVRFPVLVALNKVDSPRAVAQQTVAAVQRAWPHERLVPVTARCELLLQQLRGYGVVEYAQGSNKVVWKEPSGEAEVITRDTSMREAAESSGLAGKEDKDCLDKVKAAVKDAETNAMNVYGSTGVVAALQQALELRHPLVVFPVADIAKGTTLIPFDDKPALTFRHKHPDTVYGDCVLLRRGATVGDLVEVCKRRPWEILAGDFVRGEGRGASKDKPVQVLKKDSPVTEDCPVICCKMTRKAI